MAPIDRAVRREQLLDAADRTLRAEGPGATMADIAKQAGITKPILYRHFKDRRDLLGALAERYVEDLHVQIMAAVEAAPGPRERIAAALDAYLAYVEGDPRARRSLLEDGPEEDRARAVVGRFVRTLGEELGPLVADALAEAGQPTEPAEAWGHAIVGAAQAVGVWWLGRGSIPDRAAVVEQLTALLYDGMARGTQAGAPVSPDAG